jgi:20S proteasome subunit alpha 7
MGVHMLTYTLYASVRPFGCSAIVGIVDSSKAASQAAVNPGLYMIEPSGAYWGYNACASGRGTRNAKNELEKLSLSTLTPREAVKEAARIMYDVHNAAKDKEMELEISWICEESGWKHQFVPQELLQEAESYAKLSLEEKMQE